jgi:hypothetical protein
MRDGTEKGARRKGGRPRNKPITVVDSHGDKFGSTDHYAPGSKGNKRPKKPTQSIVVNLRLPLSSFNELQAVCGWLRSQIQDAIKITQVDGVIAALHWAVEGLEINERSRQANAATRATAIFTECGEENSPE